MKKKINLYFITVIHGENVQQLFATGKTKKQVKSAVEKKLGLIAPAGAVIKRVKIKNRSIIWEMDKIANKESEAGILMMKEFDNKEKGRKRKK